MKESLSGIVDTIIYKNSDNLYTIFNLRNDDGEITVVGYFDNLKENLNVEVNGEYTIHPKYGTQFKADTLEIILPTDKDEIFTYLASGMLSGIGEKKARDIIEVFGDDTLNIIENDPMALTSVKGIGKKTALLVGLEYKNQGNLRDVVMKLGKYNISPTYAKKLYSEYKDKTLDIIKTNPYALIDDVYGIGFKRADQIAMNVGIDKDSPYRVVSAIKYTISFICYQEGNTYIFKDDLILNVKKLIGVSKDIIEYHLSNLFIDDEIILETIDNKERCYDKNLHEAEVDSAYNLINILSYENNINIKDIEPLIARFEVVNNITLDTKQRQAVIQSITSKVSIITGGPGTGKTTIINAIIYCLGNINKSYTLTAPTGRAAKRMSESTNMEATTLHRLLEYAYINDNNRFMSFGKNEENKIDSEYIIIDEMSMVDISLFSAFLKAVPKEASLLFVGDVDQLPAVGAGNVLFDVIKSGLFNVTMLDTIHRQSEKSMIVSNAHRINQGKLPVLDSSCEDFFYLKVMTQEKIRRKILNIIYSYDQTPLRNINIISDLQVISPVKRGPAGVDELNKSIQDILNPNEDNKKEIQYGNLIYRENDKVMQIKNNYNMKWTNISNDDQGSGIFNGDMGIVKKVDIKNKTLDIIFDEEKYVSYPVEQLNELTLSYAITVHKSQGSEFKAVIIPVFSGYYGFLTRNLLYTAITRARDIVILIGEEVALKSMINNVQKNKRKTSLVEKLNSFI